MGLGVSKIDQHAVAHVLRDEATATLHGLRNALLIGRNHFPEVFRVHASRERRRPDEVREHHGHLTAFGAVFWMGAWGA
jgi:hypothetical protein